ncbi:MULTISPECIES: ABC transporter substrate-binding protein [Mycobacteriaceae]|uniref:ABC transporter substrate-binding protein n=1 Tax=Mycobacteriaceae TaxID=1762 RepID=UPI00030252EE|nr:MULTISPECIES: ABC transporter substrate-binding protein [Mycobacteriaceae]AHC27380.2 ABC transporter substrate-binding protein [Mycolicibacterium neoaurum VKM Ac-1815D]AMO07601.1 ABC transporter substrate-binding protein [Mycolicibacterium neoaurum]KJQ51553.1 ABC transporter substrate-binding protein [Mycolicibacterium neoaurum]KUM08869.1 ABC transporter substrate-binding protein [Mycolicibacterium neoaurum]WBP95286.1 ABC transporter substrate-binding protein [Mycolicibacterium neoaurum]
MLRVTAMLATLVLAVGVLAGCANNEPADPGAAGDAVTISHKFGETTVPANPRNIVTMGWNDQDFVLALGVVPVGTRAWYDNYNDFPWVKAETDGKGVPVIEGDTINFEAVAAAKPDVIFAIYETIDQKTYDQLSQIAPTVIQSADYPDEETPWDVQLLTTGKALGKEQRAKELVDEVEAKIAQATSDHPDFAGKTLVADFSSEVDAPYLIGKGDPRRALFDELGFGAQDTVGEVSQEKLSLLEGDVLFVNGVTKQQLAGSPAFQRLAVVREDRTLYAGSESTLSGALAYGGPNALLYAIDLLVPQLSNAVAGRPVADLSDS